jgi:peptidoglycan/xylan/chitin deacetylase (PgdA/CDA1 family)
VHPGERLKGGLKRAVRRAAESRTPAGARSVILTYHSVGRRNHEMNVCPPAFAQQMRWLADHCAVIAASRAAAGEPGVAITFDDGYRDNLIEAAPVLDGYRMPVTVFVVPARVGAFLDHDDPLDESARLMTWDQLREIQRRGWTIGGHTMTHCRLSRIDVDRQRSEIAGCRRAIATELGVDADGFAYPFGSALDYTDASVRMAREAGFTFAVSNRYGVNTPKSERFELRRIWIDRRDTLATFAAKVQGRLDRLAWFDSAAGIRARRLANRLLRSA